MWNKIKTGHQLDNGDDETLETFTILTTETCPELYWLNDRQPVILWDVDSALQWLQGPNESLTSTIAQSASNVSGKRLSWHPVHKQMTNLKYREPQCVDAVRVEKIPSVISFLTKRVTSINRHPSCDEQLSKDQVIGYDRATIVKKQLRQGTLYYFLTKEP